MDPYDAYRKRSSRGEYRGTYRQDYREDQRAHEYRPPQDNRAAPIDPNAAYPPYPTPVSASPGPSRTHTYEPGWPARYPPHSYPSYHEQAPPQGWVGPRGHWGPPAPYSPPGVAHQPQRSPPWTPASPSQIQQRAPPPPASAPSPKSPSSPYLPGFQPDYERSRETRRPGSNEPSSTGGAVAVTGNQVRPPPSEAYLILRPHRMPRGGWDSASEVGSNTTDNWTFDLNVLQHPERGKALGVETLRRGWPPLTPPLIVQLVVRDKDGEIVPTDNATLARRLVHITMNVEMVAPDSSESRSLMRVRPPSRASIGTKGRRTHSSDAARGNVQPYYPASAPPPYSVQKTLLGSCVRTAQVLIRDGRKGLYFIFQDMIARPEGRYALEGKILDLAGPPHIGTSIGVTHPLAHCRTNPFDVIVPHDYPGPVPITPLSTEFLRQGERHLGVSAAQLAASAKQKRRTRNDEGESDQDEPQPE